MLNEEQTKVLVQILDNLIDDYDKSIGQMEEQIGATVPGSMRIKNRKMRRYVIREIRTEIVNMGWE